MAIEIVDLPIEHGGSFHSYVNVYQRVTHVWAPRLTGISSLFFWTQWMVEHATCDV
jgi:hypothetical protein